MKCDLKTMIKIGLALAVAVGGGFLVFPQFRPVIIVLAPFALFALCPISMLFAMWGMSKNQGHQDSRASSGHQEAATGRLSQYTKI